MGRPSNAEKQQKLQSTALKLQDEASVLQSAYIEDLETNPKYSLEVNPEKKYKMTISQCKFIEYYVQYKNINTAAELASIDLDTAKKYFIAYNTQMEIRRINLAMYHRQFATRLLTIDEIGGYLSSLLMDQNVPIADRLKTSEKLRVCEMIINLNRLKIDGLKDPSNMMGMNIDIQLKNLSIDTVKELLKTSKSKSNSPADIYYDDTLSPEENAYISTLPTEELLEIIEKTKKGENDEN